MSDTKFTKGEWKVSSCGLVVNVNGHKVARAHSGGNVPYTSPSKANANLIKTSPKMYEMLNRWVNSVDCVDDNYQDCLKDETIELLAEARGEL